MSESTETDARVLEQEILEAIEKFERKTGIAVTSFYRTVVWNYDYSAMKREPITAKIDIIYETRLA